MSDITHEDYVPASPVVHVERVCDAHGDLSHRVYTRDGSTVKSFFAGMDGVVTEEGAVADLAWQPFTDEPFAKPEMQSVIRIKKGQALNGAPHDLTFDGFITNACDLVLGTTHFWLPPGRFFVLAYIMSRYNEPSAGRTANYGKIYLSGEDNNAHWQRCSNYIRAANSHIRSAMTLGRYVDREGGTKVMVRVGQEASAAKVKVSDTRWDSVVVAWRLD